MDLDVLGAVREQRPECHGRNRKQDCVAEFICQMVVREISQNGERQEHQEMRHLVGRDAEDELLHIRQFVHVHETQHGDCGYVKEE